MADTGSLESVKDALTAEQLREILSYEPSTGVFTWRTRRGPKALAGAVAGTLNPHGYIIINTHGHLRAAHRLAWLYMTGEWPSDELDHKDLVRSNNAFDNLRLATRSQNSCNSPRRSNNKSGFKGVSWDRNKSHWQATITKDRRREWLGYFDTPEEAHAAYVAAAEQCFGEFARAS